MNYPRGEWNEPVPRPSMPPDGEVVEFQNQFRVVQAVDKYRSRLNFPSLVEVLGDLTQTLTLISPSISKFVEQMR